MQIMQNVARRYGLVCLLHEKPFAGVNGSGKHNNWSMGTDTGDNLLEPGDTPHENIQFLFFCAAVIAAVNKHQALLRASVANVGQDHRLGANEAPPAIISIFLGAELEKVVRGDRIRQAGRRLERQLPRARHAGAAAAADARRRPQPDLAVRLHRQQVRVPHASARAVRSASPTPCSTRSSPRRSTRWSTRSRPRRPRARSATRRCSRSSSRSGRSTSAIIFGGDNYADAWYAEAEKRGLANLRTTPDALPWLVEKQTIRLFERYEVLSERELESRFEVAVEQYATKLNIEAETAASIARTMILPAAARHLAELKAAGLTGPATEAKAATDSFVKNLKALEKANASHPSVEGLEHAKYMRDKVIPAMDATRATADVLERIVADDLWPLPKYSEMLFIK